MKQAVRLAGVSPPQSSVAASLALALGLHLGAFSLLTLLRPSPAGPAKPIEATLEMVALPEARVPAPTFPSLAVSTAAEVVSPVPEQVPQTAADAPAADQALAPEPVPPPAPAASAAIDAVALAETSLPPVAPNAPLPAKSEPAPAAPAPAPIPAMEPAPALQPVARPAMRTLPHPRSTPRPRQQVADFKEIPAPPSAPVVLPPAPVARAVTPPEPIHNAPAEAAFEARVRQAVQDAVRYPAAARMMGVTGRARIELTYRAGAVANVAVMQSAGVAVLDGAAVNAAMAAHYPPPSAEIGDRALRFLIWVEFRAG